MLNVLNDTLNTNYKVYTAMEKTTQNLKDIEKYIIYDDTESLETYTKRKKELDVLIEDLYNIQTSLESYFIINAIYYSTKAYESYFENAIIRKQINNEQYYLDYNEGLRIQKYTNRYFNQLLLENLKQVSEKAEAVTDETNRIKKMSYNLIIVFGILALLLGILISNYIVLPIQKLSSYSKKISQGDLDIREVDMDSTDEIGDLSRAYNHMGRSIKDYVERIKEKANIEKKLHEEERAVMQMEQLLQQAKLEALQAKINPHFLFNTLNVISRTAFFEEAHETMDLIQMLSKIFRYQLKRAGEKITLAEEKVLIADYLKLQSVRFKDRLKYEIDIPPNIDVCIPVLTLQPLVENAITHGFGFRIEGGSIKIRAYEDGEKVIIEVSDNGVGIDKELVEKINSDDNLNETNGPSIGIRNVRDRFLMAFPNRSKFIVESERSVGTTVRMIIIKEGA